jgi:hypothetical protein
MNIQTADIGDYIFLILVVAASLIQAFSQNRKKAMMKKDDEMKPRSPHPFDNMEEFDQPARPQSSKESPFGSFFDQLDDILGEEGTPTVVVNKPKPVVKKEPNPAEEMAARYAALHLAENEKMAKEGQHAIDTNILTHEPKPLLARKIREKINMRQAVIYSEILNRKY